MRYRSTERVRWRGELETEMKMNRFLGYFSDYAGAGTKGGVRRDWIDLAPRYGFTPPATPFTSMAFRSWDVTIPHGAPALGLFGGVWGNMGHTNFGFMQMVAGLLPICNSRI
jgi:hypothetical protein